MKPIYINTKIHNLSEKPLNADEFQIIRNEQFLQYQSPEELIKKYESSNPDKILLSKYIANILNTLPVSSVISFGSGESVIEYLIKKNCKAINIAISDFDEKLMNHNKNLYRDIFSDYSVVDISKEQLDFLPGKYQVAFVNAVIYVLNDNQAKFFFHNLSSAKIEYVLIVYTAQLYLCNELKKTVYKFIKKLILKRNDNKENNTFWGWSRYKHEIVSIAKSKGYNLIKYDRPDLDSYKRGIYLFKLKGDLN